MKRFFQLVLFAILAVIIMPVSFGAKQTAQSAVGAIVLGFPKTTSRFCDKQQSRFIMTASKGFTLRALKSKSYGQNIHGVVANVKTSTPDVYRTDQVNVYGPKDQEATVNMVLVPIMHGKVNPLVAATHCVAKLNNSKWVYNCGGDFKGEVDMPTLGFFFNLNVC